MEYIIPAASAMSYQKEPIIILNKKSWMAIV